MIFKRTAWMILALIMAISTIGGQSVSANSSFSDIPSSHEAFDEIQYLTNLGVLKGYAIDGKTYFKPNDAVTKGQVAKMVVIATGHAPLVVSKSSFSDVAVGTELSSYVERAIQLGFFVAPSTDKFYPNKPIVRDEMSYVLAKAFQLNTTQPEGAELPFTDLTTGHAYYPYISALYFNGITQGSNGVYNVSGHVTRSQFSLFVARAKNNQFKLGSVVQGVSVPNDIDAIGFAEILSDQLNVRSSAQTTTAANIIGKLEKGTSIPVFEENEHWLKVSYDGKFAYVYKKYTSYAEEPAQQPIPTTTPKPELPSATEPIAKDVIGRVTVKDLNVRAGAGADYKLIGKLKKGEEVVVQSISNYWAKIRFGNEDGYVNKTFLKLMNQKSHVLQNRIIVLDPGHGGRDPGASRGSAVEKAIVFKVTELVRQKLETNGAKVVMTRTGDTYPSLENRVAITAKNYGELFVSVHVNAASSASAKGTETFYSVSTGDMYEEDVYLATFINKEIVQNADMNNRGVKKANYYVIKNMTIPSVLVELGFVSNAEDRAKLVNDDYIEKFAQSIYNGIVQYYEK